MGRACQGWPGVRRQVRCLWPCISWARAWVAVASVGLASWRAGLSSLATSLVLEHAGVSQGCGLGVPSLLGCCPLSIYNLEVGFLLGPGPPGAALGLPGSEMVQRMRVGSVRSDSVGAAVILGCLPNTGHLLVSAWTVPPWPGLRREALLCARQGPLPAFAVRQKLPACSGLWMAKTGTSHERAAASRVGPGPHPGCHPLSGSARSSWPPEASSVPSRRPDTLQRCRASAAGLTSLSSPLCCEC